MSNPKATFSKAKLSVPSKAFLAGEYAALLQAPSYVLNFEPRFELHAKQSNSTYNRLFHPNSLAGKLESQYLDLLSCWELNFIDPHNGAGGFGRSSAEFALLYSLVELLIKNRFELEENMDWNLSLLNEEKENSYILQTLNCYRDFAKQNSGLPASGADLVAQLKGGMTYYSNASEGSVLNSYKWPFEEIGFLVFSTGLKLKTHSHLESLSQDVISQFVAETKEPISEIKKAISFQSADLFISNLNKFNQMLNKFNFVTDHTKALLSILSRNYEVLAAKGCGALGADMILIIYDKTRFKTETDKDSLIESIKFSILENNKNILISDLSLLTYKACDADLGVGLKIKKNY